MPEKTYSAMAGILERRGRILAPAGMMWSVVILAPTLIKTEPVRDFASGPRRGKGLILGPRTIETFAESAAGGIIMLSSMMNFSGSGISGYSPRVLGSVSTPVRAEAAATSGLAR